MIYTLNNLSSLTTLAGTYTLTFTAAGSGVTDAVNNAAAANASTTFNITHAAPQIAAVYVSSSAWQQSFLNYLATNGQGDAQFGYRIPAGANQLATLPWANINVIAVQFTEDVTLNTAHTGLALVGSPDLAVAPALSTAAFSYSSATRVASWTYSSPLSLDKYLISIPSTAATNGLGANLDGEWTTSVTNYPSGDGTAGGDFNFRFNVLPGDVDQNGAVNALDGGNVRQHFLQHANMAGYNPLDDTYGKGAITGIDFTTVQGALFSVLPGTDPSPPPGQGGGGGSAAAAVPNAAPAVANTSSAPAVTLTATTPAAASPVGASAAPNPPEVRPPVSWWGPRNYADLLTSFGRPSGDRFSN